MQRERWRQIAGTVYEVSDHGRVRGPRGLRKHYVDDGYCKILLRIDGKYHLRLVHRLVLEAFRGPCPPGKECRHGKGKRSNNRLSNLKWGTKKENTQDRDKHGTTARGERHGCAKLTRRQVTAIQNATGPRGIGNKLARHYGVAKGTISFIRNRQTWN